MKSPISGSLAKKSQRQLTRMDTETWVEGHGIVTQALSENDDDSHHQRFVLDMRNGQTLLIVHNTDLAPRAPVGLGDRVSFRGFYEWNRLGGVVHWTHHDPMGAEHGGFIKHRRRTYR